MLTRTELIALANLKDLLGLAGAGLIAIPFFRLEGDKRDAQRLNHPATTDPALKDDFAEAGRDVKQKINQPSAPDYQATLWGLGLLGLSFAISILLSYLSP